MRRNRPFNRRWLTPLIILIVGGALTIWASRAEMARTEDIRLMVEDICASAARGVDLTHRLPTSHTALNRPLNDMLKTSLAPLDSQVERITVVVTPGPEPGLGEKQTRFTAMIRIDGEDSIALEIMRENEKSITITGYSDPVRLME